MRVATTLLLVLVACTGGEDEFGYTGLNGACMGTTWSATVELTPNSPTAAAATALIQARLDDVDRAMSTWKEDSDLSRLNRAPAGETVEASALTLHVLELATEFVAVSDGAFDPTVGPMVKLWGFHSQDLTDGVAPSAAAQAEALGQLGWDAIETRPTGVARTRADVEVDLSAIAKGYAVDLAAQALVDAGVENFLLEVGGELFLRGVSRRNRPWQIGINDPRPPKGFDPNSVMAAIAPRTPYAVVAIADRALATSGDYRNVRQVDGKLVAHALDPRTGRPIDHDLASVSVVAATCAEADALATAALVLGPKAGLAMLEQRSGVEGYLLVRGDDGAIQVLSTAGMAALVVSAPRDR